MSEKSQTPDVFVGQMFGEHEVIDIVPNGVVMISPGGQTDTIDFATIEALFS